MLMPSTAVKTAGAAQASVAPEIQYGDPKVQRKLNFLTSLYPQGRSVDDIIKQIARISQMSDNEASEKVSGQIALYEKEELVSTMKRRNEEIVVLTKRGKDEIYSYVSHLRSVDIQKFFTYICEWTKNGDKGAEKLYKQESAKIFKENPRIAGMLPVNLYENDIIESYSKLIGAKPDDKIAAEVLHYLGMLISINFVATKTVAQDNKPVYFLTKEGRNALNRLYDTDQTNVTQSHAPAPKAETDTKRRGAIYLIIMSITFLSIIIISSLLDLSQEFLIYTIPFSCIPILSMFIIEFFPMLFTWIGKHAKWKK